MSELLSGPCERCCSSLLADDLTALLSLILTLIGLKVRNAAPAPSNYAHCACKYTFPSVGKGFPPALVLPLLHVTVRTDRLWTAQGTLPPGS